MADDNVVNIYVFDENGAALNVMGWPVAFGEGVSTESIYMPTPTLSWESETCFTIHFATDRTGAQWVADGYMNAGYGIPAPSAGSAWPDNQPLNGDNPCNRHVCPFTGNLTRRRH